MNHTYSKEKFLINEREVPRDYQRHGSHVSPHGSKDAVLRSSESKRRERKRDLFRSLFSLVIFCLGIGVSLYPYAAQQVNNISATKLVAAINADFDKGMTGAGGDAPAYAGELDLEGAYGSIFIPKLSLELPIYVGQTEANLSKGIAHLEGSSLPTGGESTHAVLAGHNGAVTNEWFTNIDKLEVGDLFYIRSEGSVLTYKVESMEIIEATDTHKLLIQRERDLVTLLTCANSGQQRLIVTGERFVE